MNREDIIYWSKFRDVVRATLNHDEYLIVCEIYARIKSQKPHYPCKSCGTSGAILQGYINEINLAYDNEPRK